MEVPQLFPILCPLEEVHKLLLGYFLIITIKKTGSLVRKKKYMDYCPPYYWALSLCFQILSLFWVTLFVLLSFITVVFFSFFLFPYVDFVSLYILFMLFYCILLHFNMLPWLKISKINLFLDLPLQAITVP